MVECLGIFFFTGGLWKSNEMWVRKCVLGGYVETISLLLKPLYRKNRLSEEKKRAIGLESILPDTNKII